MPHNYSIHFSIETISDKLQKICDDLLSDLQSHTINNANVDKLDLPTHIGEATPIQLHYYLIDEDERNISVEVKVSKIKKHWII